MRDPKRIDPMLELIGSIWKKNPDLRLGQLLVNALTYRGSILDPFFIEDDDLTERLREFEKRLNAFQKASRPSSGG